VPEYKNAMVEANVKIIEELIFIETAATKEIVYTMGNSFYI
jgi:hypothetical protein